MIRIKIRLLRFREMAMTASARLIGAKTLGTTTLSKMQLIGTIEIGLEQTPFVFNFFSSFEHVKSLLIMGPNNTKNSSLKCDLFTNNYE